MEERVMYLTKAEKKAHLKKDIENYKTSRHLVYGIDTKRPLTLMDLATISMKELRKTGCILCGKRYCCR